MTDCFTGGSTQLIYKKLPGDISERHVLLLDPVLGTGMHAALIPINFREILVVCLIIFV